MHKALYIEETVMEEARTWASSLAATLQKELIFTQDIEEEADMVFICCECKRAIVRHWLNQCRELRIPYILLTPAMRHLKVLALATPPLREILAPVTRLEEEVYKAELTSHLMRYTGAHTRILRAHDYGSRAKRNAERIASFLSSRAEALHTPMNYCIEEAKCDSDSLHKELTDRHKDFTPDIILQTASREYGLDDLIFGPAEQHLILHAQVPVVLLNPREDLFSLCD